MNLNDQFHKNAIIYGVDVEAFVDGDGDGIGDFPGLIDRLDHLSRLGVTCLWLLPFYPTPNRDNGYDVMDYYGIDPRHGTLGDFVEFIREADARGIDVIIDLVINHTSDQHPWFQAARQDADSPYREYYFWTDDPPPTDPGKGNVFPGEEEADRVWTYDEMAEVYYYHRFYHFQPDLNVAHPAVREEIKKIIGFWLELGVSGFRIDAAGLLTQKPNRSSISVDAHAILKDLRQFVNRRRGDAVLLAEADVPLEELPSYVGNGDEMHALLNFQLNSYLMLALAREEAAPLVDFLDQLPALPEEGQWVNFLRNYDELNLGGLPPSDREEVFEAFAPAEEMRIYGRGIRRRLAPMLNGNPQRIALAFSLLFSLPGTPLLVYGAEIGMGDDLSLPGRTAVRTPMQWSSEPNGGFSAAPATDLIRPVITDGPFGYEQVNVADQWVTPDSLLRRMERLIETRAACPELGWGDLDVLETELPGVIAHRCDWEGQAIVAVHNLTDDSQEVTLDLDLNGSTFVSHLLGDAAHPRSAGDRYQVDLSAYGYCWLRAGGIRQMTEHV